VSEIFIPRGVGANVDNVLSNLRLFEYLFEGTGSCRELPLCVIGSEFIWTKRIPAKLYVVMLLLARKGNDRRWISLLVTAAWRRVSGARYDRTSESSSLGSLLIDIFVT
jgi:hypothetical protein